MSKKSTRSERRRRKAIRKAMSRAQRLVARAQAARGTPAESPPREPVRWAVMSDHFEDRLPWAGGMGLWAWDWLTPGEVAAVGFDASPSFDIHQRYMMVRVPEPIGYQPSRYGDPVIVLLKAVADYLSGLVYVFVPEDGSWWPASTHMTNPLLDKKEFQLLVEEHVTFPDEEIEMVACLACGAQVGSEHMSRCPLGPGKVLPEQGQVAMEVVESGQGDGRLCKCGRIRWVVDGRVTQCSGCGSEATTAYKTDKLEARA